MVDGVYIKFKKQLINDVTDKVQTKVSYLVAIGASAGGLEAINEFFDNFPPNDNFSFVIIQHLSAEHKSLLVELMGKHTHMAVHEAQEGMFIKPKEIYVIPNNRFITLKHGKLKLIDKNSSGPNNAVDVFLNSLAEEKKEKAVAIILSGTGSDGTKGIENVKKQGGLVIVQDPLSAKFDGMPNSAIASGQADLILEPELMPEEMFRLLQQKPDTKSYSESIVDDEKAVEQILKYIYQYTSYDFTHYKKPTISRRIVRRMVALEYGSISDYYKFLIENKKELQILCQDFLIGVTKFFRNNEAYSILESKVLPQLLAHKPDNEPIKVWVAACSTGQEAYSIAILIDECLSKLGKPNEVKIFASDIDKIAIEKASKGSYSISIVNEISPDRLSKYFVKKGEEYIVIPKIRKMIVFANHNVIKDPPYSRTDLVSCRNMLIYMDVALQKKVLASLHFSLNTYGYLFLGSSENLNTSANNFREVDRKWKIYQNVNPGKIGSDFYKLASPVLSKPAGKLVKEPKSELLELFKDMVSMEYNMAMFKIDNFYNIRETVGDYSNLLKLPSNSLSFNILKMVPEKLASILGNTIRKAVKENKQVSEKNIRLLSKEGTRLVDIIAKPSDGSLDIMATIVLSMSIETKSLDQNTLSSLKKTHDHSNSYVETLETELKETQQNLQSAIEELETTNEELQSGNEELLSANEELQSSNEELQSLNEELHTVNSEHQLKIKELVELNEDLDNYFRSSFIGQLFLDDDLRIRKFNSSVREMINVMDSDIGRPIQHLSNNFKIDHLLEDLRLVKHGNKALEKEVELNGGSTFLMRIQNYVLFDKTTSGYVISFIDVSDVRRLNNIIKVVFNSSPNGIVSLNAVRGSNHKIIDFEFTSANKVGQTMFGIKGEVEHTRLLKLLSPEQSKELFLHFSIATEKSEPIHFEYCYQEGTKESCYDVTAVKLNDGVVVTFSDVTEKKEVERRLNENFDQLLDTEEQLRKLNIDLESRIKTRTLELAESEERFSLVSKATNDAIWDWNLVGNTIWFNESFSNQFGYRNGELNTGIDGWLSKIEEDDRQLVHKSLLEAINKGKKQWSSEYRFIKADGTSSIIYDRGYILQDEYGTPIRILSSMLDVTPLKEAQSEMVKSSETTRFIADAIPELLWIADAEGNINFFNQKWFAYTDKTFEDLTKGFEEYVHPQDLSESLRRWTDSLSSGKRFEREHRILDKTGKYNWFLARAEAKRNDDGNISLWIMTHTNIHEQKTNEELLEQKVLERTAEVKESIEQLEKSNEQLEKSNYDLLQFASVASHDLKEPLRKILTFSSLLQKSNDYNETSNRYINSIVKTSERMRRLIDDLLMFSRLSDGNIQFEEIDINELIDEIKFDLEILVKEKQASINYTGLSVIHGIPGQIRQLFQNLLSNSLKFSKKDVAPVIDISASMHTIGGRQCVRIIFQDNGIGFQELYSEKIFVIFQRLHPKQMYEGTGIGLAIVKKIVSLHGGEIVATGVENVGATFEITFPQ